LSDDVEKNEHSMDAENTAVHPILAPPEKTGITPEEEAYVPDAKQRSMPKSVFIIVVVLLLAAFGVGGTVYYRGNVLPERFFQIASRHFENGSYAEALEFYNKVLELKPDRKGARFLAAYSMEMLGHDSDAINAYVSHLTSEPGDVDALTRLGSLYFRLGMHQEAREPLEKALGRDGVPVSVDYMLGAVQETLGNPKMASESYIAVITSESRDPELFYAASLALMRMGYYKEALDGFNKMSLYVKSGDKRAFHSINAAKSMLGWPTDPNLVIVPGKSIGGLSLGVTSADVLSSWGKPIERVTEGDHAIWSYGGRVGALETLVYMEKDSVIEIVTSAKKFKTSDGIGITNFMEPKYADRFERWAVNKDGTPLLRRYMLNGGGLAFYSAGEHRSAVIHSGDKPLSNVDGYEWVRLD
jgi:Tfp pilus assembly protein PilF